MPSTVTHTIATLPLVTLVAVGTPAWGQEVLRGRVLDTEGRPIAGAIVAMALDATGRPPRQTRTDRAGRFRMRVEGSAANLVMSAWAPGLLPALRACGPDTTFSLARGADTLRGTVTGPRAGWVYVFPGSFDGGVPADQQLTGGVVPIRDGHMTVALPNGEYWLKVDAPGFKGDMRSITVTGGATFTTTLRPLAEPATPAVEAWLRANAHPVRGVTAGIGFDDLQPSSPWSAPPES